MVINHEPKTWYLNKFKDSDWLVWQGEPDGEVVGRGLAFSRTIPGFSQPIEYMEIQKSRINRRQRTYIQNLDRERLGSPAKVEIVKKLEIREFTEQEIAVIRIKLGLSDRQNV